MGRRLERAGDLADRGFRAQQRGDLGAGPPDPEAAVPWLERAARHGVSEAAYTLGLLYRRGLGVPRDPHRCFWWTSLAAEGGHRAAQVNLGILYRRGEGVRADAKRATHWVRRAAEAGSAPAQRRLSRCYAAGIGVAADLAAAYMWATLAEDAGDAAGRELRRVLAARLPARHRWEGRARAASWRRAATR